MERVESSIDRTKYIDMAFKLLLLFALVYFTTINFHTPIISFGFILAATAWFLTGRIQTKMFFQYVMLSLLVLIEILADWTRPANHHYILFYFCLSFVLANFKKHDPYALLFWNFRCAVGLLIFLAGVQKLLSPQYNDGSFLNFLGITGSLGPHTILPTYVESGVVQANIQIINAFNQGDPNNQASLALQQFEGFTPFFFKVFSWISILIEIVLGMLILFRPAAALTHFLLVATMASIYIISNECGFLCLLCIGGYVLASKNHSKFTAVYMALFLIFMTLIIVKIGYP